MYGVLLRRTWGYSLGVACPFVVIPKRPAYPPARLEELQQLIEQLDQQYQATLRK